ncbi:MAG: hypothetical protein Q8M76_03115 [Spirochaetaceae bacterium]|nr:hypothetical protein [Spirochaetaceae bacterium]
MGDQAAEFWSAFEAETGEKVEARGMGQWFESEQDDRGLWGIMILTDRSFRFKYMPSESWIQTVFRSSGRESQGSKPFDIVIPRGDLVSVNSPKRGFLSRVFGQAYEILNLTWRVAAGEKTVRIGMEPRGSILAALGKATLAREMPST